MDICVYVHVNKIIRCEYNNRGGCVGGGGASEIRQTWGSACPKSLKTPAVVYTSEDMYSSLGCAYGLYLH